jgi:antitoxin Phd
MKTWQVHDAKARFSELLNAAQAEGPQIVLRRGRETAVLMSIDEWRRMKSQPRMTIKEWLTVDIARGELNIPDRTPYRLRQVPDFE